MRNCIFCLGCCKPIDPERDATYSHSGRRIWGKTMGKLLGKRRGRGWWGESERHSGARRLGEDEKRIERLPEKKRTQTCPCGACGAPAEP